MATASPHTTPLTVEGPATREDKWQIIDYLQQDIKRKGLNSSEGSFWHNLGPILDAANAGQLRTIAMPANLCPHCGNSPRKLIGYAVIGRYSGDIHIFEILPEFRGKGLGKRFVECLLTAGDDVWSEDAPDVVRVRSFPDAVFFWARIGFEPYDDEDPLKLQASRGSVVEDSPEPDQPVPS